jgi:outer membrane immunogenic protein
MLASDTPSRGPVDGAQRKSTGPSVAEFDNSSLASDRTHNRLKIIGLQQSGAIGANTLLRERYMARGPVFVLFGLGVLACASAHAADLGGYAPAPPPTYIDSRPALMWTGLYVGLNAGYSFSRDSTGENSVFPYNGVAPERVHSGASGFTGGGQIGYNYQMGHFVVGIEADFNYVDLSRTKTSLSGAVTEDISGNFIGTVRPRVGVAFGPALLYATGGLAYGSVDTTITGNTANTLSASSSGMRVGWAAGAGAEYALNRNLSLRLEYLHTDLGRADVSGVALDTNTYAWHDHLTDNVVRLGVNFRF